jgi:hypothetical protein
VFSEEKAVVGIHDEHGFVPQIEFVHEVEDFAQVFVAHADERGVFIAAMAHLFRRLRHIAVVGPIEVGAVVVVGIEVLVLLLGEIGFVGVEGFDVEKPVVLLPVGAHELKAVFEGTVLRLEFFSVHFAAVHPIGRPKLTKMFGWGGGVDVGFPEVPFLAPVELKGTVAGMVGAAAIFPIVVVVGGEVAVDTVALENLRHRIVERFEGTPAPVEKAIAARVEFAAGGHARHAAHIGALKGDALFGEALEVGRVRPVAAVGRQHVAVQRIEHDHDGFHKESPFVWSS